MYLSDVDIMAALQCHDIGISKFNQDRLQPASYDLTLGNVFKVFVQGSATHIDKNNFDLPSLTKEVIVNKVPFAPITDDHPHGLPNHFVLHPGQFALGSTIETITIGKRHIAKLDGRSSGGRLGVIVHATAGFVDPGWDGELTLEFSNLLHIPIFLYPGQKIAQISFAELKTESSRAYDGHYMKQKGPVHSRGFYAT